jgi:hypothetical protein
MKPKVEPAPITFWVNRDRYYMYYAGTFTALLARKFIDNCLVFTKPKSTKGWIKFREMKPLSRKK